VVAQAAKFEVESYFSQINFHKDEWLKKAQGAEGWIFLELIYDFGKMKKFHDRIKLKNLYEILKLSADVEVKEEIRDWGDEQEIAYYIRKKKLLLKGKYVKFLGYDVETIK